MSSGFKCDAKAKIEAKATRTDVSWGRVLAEATHLPPRPPSQSVPSALGTLRGRRESSLGTATWGGGGPHPSRPLRPSSVPRAPWECWARWQGVLWGLGPQCFIFGPDQLPALASLPAGLGGRPGKLGVSWSQAGRMPCNDKHKVGTHHTRVKWLHGL